MRIKEYLSIYIWLIWVKKNDKKKEEEHGGKFKYFTNQKRMEEAPNNPQLWINHVCKYHHQKMTWIWSTLHWLKKEWSYELTPYVSDWFWELSTNFLFYSFVILLEFVGWIGGGIGLAIYFVVSCVASTKYICSYLPKNI